MQPLRKNEYTVSSIRAETFVMSTEPSEVSIYTSKYFTEQERRFFIDNLFVKSVEFSGSSNTQVFCRCLSHDLNRQVESNVIQSVVSRGQETVLLLHAFTTMTTSWTWIKFSMTLFREGFNVVMIDLPGFGKSSIARDIHCKLEVWKQWDVQVVSQTLEKLGVSKVNVVACYETASTFFNLMAQVPHLLGKNHVLHNPMLAPEEMVERRMNGIIRSMIAGGLKRRIFASFDRAVTPEAGHGALSETLLGVQKFLQQISKSAGFKQIILASVGPVDIAEVCIYEATNQPGIRPVFALYPAKAYRIYMAQYLAGENLPDYKHVDSRVSSQLTFPSDKYRQPSSMSIVSQPSQDFSPPSDQYSYGSRLRQLEDDLVMAMALKESEQTYLDSHGEEDIIQQHALADSLAMRTADRKSLATRLTNKDISRTGEYLDHLVDKQDEILRDAKKATGRTDLSEEAEAEEEDDDEAENTTRRRAVRFFGSSGLFDGQGTKTAGIVAPAHAGSTFLTKLKLGFRHVRSRFSTS